MTILEFPVLFSTVKVKLGHKFSQLILKFKIWILKCQAHSLTFQPRIFPSFTQLIKRWEIVIFEILKLHFQIFPNSLKRLKIEIFVPFAFIFGQMARVVFQYDGMWHQRSQFMIKLAVFKKC